MAQTLSTSLVPAIPEPSESLPLAVIEQTSNQIVAWSEFALLDDAVEALDRSLALEQYLKKRKVAGPMQVAGRHLERRIGELLGQPRRGRPKTGEIAFANAINHTQQYEFRLIAKWWVQVAPKLPCSRAQALRIAKWWESQGEQLVIQLGHGSVREGDALEWLKTLEPSGYDLLFTDPPYSTDVEDIDQFAADWVPLALQRLGPQGRAYICIGAYPDEIHAYLNALGDKEIRDWWRCQDILVWTFRNTIGPSGVEYSPNWQAILHVTGINAPDLNFSSLTDRFSVIDIPASDGRHEGRLHAWQKPDDLADRLMRHAGQVNRVLDPFCGTGTFIAAAVRHGAEAEGCDRDPAMLEFCAARGIRIVGGP